MLFPFADHRPNSPSHNFFLWFYYNRKGDSLLINRLRHHVNPLHEHTKAVITFFDHLIEHLNHPIAMSRYFRECFHQHKDCSVTQGLWRDTFRAVDESLKEELGINYSGFRKRAFRLLLLHIDRELMLLKIVRTTVRKSGKWMDGRDGDDKTAVDEEEVMAMLSEFSSSVKSKAKRRRTIEKTFDRQLIQHYMLYVNQFENVSNTHVESDDYKINEDNINTLSAEEIKRRLHVYASKTSYFHKNVFFHS